MDEYLYQSKRDRGVDGLGLFAEPMDVRVPAPVAPGSESSRLAGEALDASGRTKTELDRVLIWFAAQSSPRTRHECADALYPESGGLGSACGRINTLVWLEKLAEVGRQGKRATLAITPKGRVTAAQLIEAAA